MFGGLAQPVRVPASHAGGRAFEPRSPHQNENPFSEESGFSFSIFIIY